MPPEDPQAQLPPEPTDFERVINSLDAQKQQELEQAKHQQQIGAVTGSGEKIVQTLQNNTAELTSSIHDLLLATLVSKDPEIVNVAKNLSKLLDAISKATDNVKGANFQPLASQLKELQTTLKNIPKQIEAAHQASDPVPHLQEIAQTLGAKDFKPNISVRAPAVDLSSLEKILGELRDAAKTKPELKTDNTKLEKAVSNVQNAVQDVTKAITSLTFPSSNYVLPFKDSTGKATQAQLDSSGNLPVSGTFAVGSKSNNGGVPGSNNLGTLPAVATAAAPSYTEGNQVGLSTDLSGAVRVSGSISVGGTTDNSAFTAGTSQGTPSMGFYHSAIDTVTDGRAAALAIDSKRNLLGVIRDAAGNARGANVTASNELLVSVNNASIPVTGTFWQATQPISAASLPLPSGAATAAKQPALGTAGTASADVLTVQGIASMTALKVDGSAVTQPVSLAAGAAAIAKAEDVASADADVGVPAMAVRKATPANTSGTDGDYEMLQMSAGRLWTSTTVDTALPAGTNAIGKLAANSGVIIGDVNVVNSNVSVNQAQVAGTTTATNNGTSSAGTQRVTVASDSTGQVAPAANATSTGLSLSYQSALTNTKVAVNASAGNFYGFKAYNPNNAVTYIQLFNVASASVTVGTTTPTDVLVIPPQTVEVEFFPIPIAYGTALTAVATTTASGSTAPTSTLNVTFYYK